MNVIPACLFFFFLLSMVALEAVRLGLKGMPTEDIPSVRRVLAEGWHFILPLGVIIGLLFASSEEHTSELQSLMRNSYAVFCLTKKNTHHPTVHHPTQCASLHT